MSLGTLASRDSNQTIRMRSKPNVSSDIVIAKPPTLPDKCSLENQSKRFPVIGDGPEKKKHMKKSVSSSDSLEFWLKPGISLPKLHSKDIPQERVEAGEPFTCFSYSNLSKKKTESELYEILSSDSVKCLQTKSEVLEVPPCFVGPSPCQDLFKVPSSELNLDKLQAEEEIIEEDNALKNWRKWTRRHKNQERYLSKRLNKTPCNLLLQKADLYRQEVENKMVLSAAKVPVPDKWRGSPGQWVGPIEARKKKGNFMKLGRALPPAYFLQPTASQKGIMTDIEFVHTPKIVKKEKFLDIPIKVHAGLIKAPEKVGDSILAEAEKRVEKFLKSRVRMRPPSIYFDQMAIVGNKIQQMPEQVTPDPSLKTDVPFIEVTGPDNETSFYDFLKSAFCLVINGVKIKYELGQKPQNENVEDYNYKWELDFGVNEPEKRVEKTLQIENQGTVAVRYRWISKLGQGQKLSMLVPKQHEPSFFFNKNSGIFLPGQFYNLKFYYNARKSGVQTETWYLKTIPSLGQNGECGTIILSGVSSGGNSDLKSRTLELYLKERLRESIVKFILNIVLEKVVSCDESLYEVEYQSLFSEKQLFEYHNANYYYHSETVGELSKIFEKIPSKIQSNWDLSLDSLKKIISTNTKGPDRENLLRELCRMAKAVLTPCRVFSRKENKYRMAYNILCKMTNFMEADYDYLRNILSNKKREVENSGEYCVDEETLRSLTSEEKSEWDLGSVESVYEIKPFNLIYFQTMFYIRVYHRVSEAVESIASMIETSKKFESSRNIDYASSRPFSTSREFDFFPCLQMFSNN